MPYSVFMASPYPDSAGNPESNPLREALTAEVLAGVCQDIVEEDTQFAEQLRPRTRVSYDWDTPEGVTYAVGLTGWHEYKEDDDGLDGEAAYLGQGYELELEASFDLDESDPIPDELLQELAKEKAELPDDIFRITVTYAVGWELSPDRRLGWDAVRYYDIEYVAPVDSAPAAIPTGSEYTATNPDDRAVEVSRLNYMRVALKGDSYQVLPLEAETMLPVPDESDDDGFLRLVDQLIESCQSDPQGEWLNLALSITEMIKFRSEGDFDLSRAFPPEILAIIDEARE